LTRAARAPLIAAIFQGPAPDPGSLVFGDGVNPVLARLAAGQDPGGVELAGGAATIGFAALAAQQIEGALDHRPVAL